MAERRGADREDYRPGYGPGPSRRRLVLGAVTGALSLEPGKPAEAAERRLDLTGLVQLPVEDWSDLSSRIYSPATRNRSDLMWRTTWAAAGDRFVSPTLSQVQEYNEPYGPAARGGVVVDGPTSPLVGYSPFSVIKRRDGSRALRITPRFVAPHDRTRTYGYPIISGVMSTAGKTLDANGSDREFYASNYSVTIYRGVRLPVGMWAAIWQYPRRNYGTSSATEVDAVETLHGLGPRRTWLSVHSDDAEWRARIVADPERYDPRLTRWAGERNVSRQLDISSYQNPDRLFDIAVVVSPTVTQHWIGSRLCLELPTPRDMGDKLRHDILDLGYPNERGAPASASALDYLEIGPIERYTYPGVSRVVWRQREVGDGALIPGARRVA